MSRSAPTNYTSQLIEDQQARTAADTLINDASVRATTGQNGFDDTLPDPRLPGARKRRRLERPLRPGVAPIVFPPISSSGSNCCKGPGALINGIAPGGSVGGGINIVTKRAGEIPFTRVTPFFMSAGNYGLHLETSGRYGENKEWGVRFNGVGRNGEASIDNGNWRSGLGALGVDYRGERFRWTLDAISQNDDTRNFRPQMGIQTTVPFIPVVPDARSNWYPGTMLKQRDNTIATAAEYDIAECADGLCGRSAIARARTTRRSLIPVSPDTPAAWTNSAISGSSTPTMTPTARRRAAMRASGRASRSGPSVMRSISPSPAITRRTATRMLPIRRPSRCHRISTIRRRFRWSPARACRRERPTRSRSGAWRSPTRCRS